MTNTTSTTQSNRFYIVNDDNSSYIVDGKDGTISNEVSNGILPDESGLDRQNRFEKLSDLCKQLNEAHFDAERQFGESRKDFEARRVQK